MRINHFKKMAAALIISLFLGQLIPARPVWAAPDRTAYYAEMGAKLEEMANKHNIPPVLLKAIAWMESGWKQYNLDPSTGEPLTDQPLIGADKIGIGIMQVSSYDPNDTATVDRLKNDIDYNIEVGCQMLNQKWRAYPKIGNGDRNVLENWYLAVWGYNSWATRNNPNYLTGKNAYQDSVFSLMGQKYNSAVTFAPGATKLSPALLPPVNPPSLQSCWSTPEPTHLGDLAASPDSLISSGGSAAEPANGDYWYNYAGWSAYYALGFYVTAYNSASLTDKTAVTQKILDSYKNLLTEADALLTENKDTSYATAAKYYWTVLQGPVLESGLSGQARAGHQNALTKLLAAADQLTAAGAGDGLTTAVQDYIIVLQGSSQDAGLTEQAKTGLLQAYTKLLTEADQLASAGTDTAKATAAGYYLTVLQGPVLDAALKERAEAGYQETASATPSTPSTPSTPQTPSAEVTALRLAGQRAEDTAIKIAQEGWGDSSAPVVLLARADRFQDALAAAPLARKLKAPLLLTGSDRLESAVLEEIQRLGARDKVYVIGGSGAIKETVTDSLSKANFTVERIYGTTAADTAAEIARKMGPSTQVILASSVSFPDALSASAPAAALGMPILLTEQKALPEATKQILADFEVSKTIVVGGNAVISTALDGAGGPLEGYGPLRLAGKTKYDTMLLIVNYFNQNPETLVVATGENFPDGLTGGAFAALTESPMLLIPKTGLDAETKAYLTGLKGRTTKVFILGGTGVIAAENETLLKDLLTP